MEILCEVDEIFWNSSKKKDKVRGWNASFLDENEDRYDLSFKEIISKVKDAKKYINKHRQMLSVEENLRAETFSPTKNKEKDDEFYSNPYITDAIDLSSPDGNVAGGLFDMDFSNEKTPLKSNSSSKKRSDGATVFRDRRWRFIFILFY